VPRFGLSDLAKATLRDVNLAWHRLDGWPDATPGLGRLKQRVLIAPVSNGNISLMVDVARRNGFPWDAILGAETAGDYKPKPRVYLAACEAFDLVPGDCVMVAAHSSDLAAAAACGLGTAHPARPNERGPGNGEAAPKVPVDHARHQPAGSRRPTLRFLERFQALPERVWGNSRHFTARTRTASWRWAGSSFPASARAWLWRPGRCPKRSRYIACRPPHRSWAEPQIPCPH
jgi:HAD superfamily hydrolase (TIGR01493 family)